MTGLRAFVTVFVGALAIRRPNPTWDFIILNKSRIGPPRRGGARHTPCFRILFRCLSQAQSSNPGGYFFLFHGIRGSSCKKKYIMYAYVWFTPVLKLVVALVCV